MMLLFLCGCNNESVVGTYKWYDTYDRPARKFSHVIACNPAERGNPFVSDVFDFQHDENSLQMHVMEQAGDSTYYVVILPHEGGFDCRDDERVGPLDKGHFESFCDSLGIPILL
jgi:hypothetical protein